jgi:DNA-binding response OmpR family regulator
MENLLWVLEDDESMVTVYRGTLSKFYRVEYFSTLQELRETFDRWPKLAVIDRPDLLILDLELPDGKTIALTYPGGPIWVQGLPFVIVSGEVKGEMMEACFSHGALDYVNKPFYEEPILVKVRRWLEQLAETPRLAHGFNLNRNTHILSRLGINTQLTEIEAQIFRSLSFARGRPMPAQELADRIWPGEAGDNNRLRVHISHLREKLQPHLIDVTHDKDHGYLMVPKTP